MLSYFIFMTCLPSIVYIPPTETFLKTNVIKILCLKKSLHIPHCFQAKVRTTSHCTQAFLAPALAFCSSICSNMPHPTQYTYIPHSARHITERGFPNTEHSPSTFTCTYTPLPSSPWCQADPSPLQDHLRSHLLD